MEYPLFADYALIRAYRSDTFGNLQYRLSQRNFNPIMAMAARITWLKWKKTFWNWAPMDPDNIHTPGICVDRVVLIPPDGIPEEAVYRD